MSDAVTAQLIRRSDSEAVIEYLARDPLPNLLLLELASRLGQATTAGEVRSEAAVARRAGDQVVHADHFVAFAKKALAEVGAQKAGPTRNQGARCAHGTSP